MGCSRCFWTHLGGGRSDVHPLPVFVVGVEHVVVDSTVFDGVVRNYGVHHGVFQPNALAPGRNKDKAWGGGRWRKVRLNPTTFVCLRRNV